MATMMTNPGIMERARKLIDAVGRRSGKQAEDNSQATETCHAKRGSDTAQFDPLPIWMKTEARVTECHREPSKRWTQLLRVTKAHDNVIVSFTYYAHAQIYYDDFRSSVVREQGEAFSVYYNALSPRQNTLSPSKFTIERALSKAALLSVMLFSLHFLAMTSE
jgi:hypothetical protein